MRRFLHIALVAVLLLSACGPRRIPREKMEAVLTDMLLRDQQIKQDSRLRRQADTSLVYEGIFESYGYNTDDFLYSLEYYLTDATRMEKMMGRIAARLEGESKSLGAELRLKQWRDRLLSLYAQPVDTTLQPRPRTRPVDTLQVRFCKDSVYLHRPDSL